MLQSLSNENVLKQFENNYFDYIIFDEVHHASSKTYQNIYNYFKPKFLLGMSATPEPNNTFNIFQMFDYNIALELRLGRALEEEIVVPFHYYGISDLILNGQTIDEKSDLSLLTADERVKHIINMSKYYGYNGKRLKGLIFTKNVDEAKILSNKLNINGYRTISLSGEDNSKTREDAIKRLEVDDDPNYLDFILTRDIFNEGVDIPSVNQVILLRPTESAIVFIQQLGRGLRLNKNKDYLVVIDMIANYERNYLIPMALNGNTTYKKDELRRLIVRPELVGSSTIYLDKIIKEQLLNNIDKANFQIQKELVSDYTKLKNKIGRIPNHQDFETYGYRDIQNYIEKYDSYYYFKKYIVKENISSLNEKQELIFKLISKKLSKGIKINELLVLKLLIENNNIVDINTLGFDEHGIKTLINFLTGRYFVSSDKKLYENINLIDINNNLISLSCEFEDLLKDDSFKIEILDLIEYSINNYNTKYKSSSKFVIGKQYSVEEVVFILNWEKQEVPLNVGGYKDDKDTNTFPIFVTYKKDENVDAGINYLDHFIDNKTLAWDSKNSRYLTSPEIVRLSNYETNKMSVYLFVKKNKDDLFYYLGEIKPIKDSFKEDKIDNKNLVRLNFKLEQEVDTNLYKYITGDI